MKRMSVAAAKAHFSEIVGDASRGKKIVILRHGKPAAMVTPIEAPPKRAAATLTQDEVRASVEAFVREFSDAEPEVSAVRDLTAGRR